MSSTPTEQSAPRRVAVPGGNAAPPKRDTREWVRESIEGLNEYQRELVAHLIDQSNQRAADANEDARDARKQAKFLIVALVFFVLLAFALVLDRSLNITAGMFSGGTSATGEP